MASQHDAINLSQGFPDFDGDQRLIKRVEHYLNAGKNQYAPMEGILALREQLSIKTEELYSANYDPETEITITAGATQGLYTAISTVINEGDEVVIFEPAYDSYTPAIELNGGKVVRVALSAPTYTVDWKLVKNKLSERTKMIIINTPHNPTGSILSDLDMKALSLLIENTDIIILSDEVYEHIIFDGLQHQSVARFPKLAERSFIVSSFGKTYHTTGWKLGYCVAPKNLMSEFRKVHQFQVFCVNAPIQFALADFLKEKDAYLELGNFYQEKRDYFNQAIDSSKFKHIQSKGTYFQLLDYSAINTKKDTDFATELTKIHGLASIPISVFYEDNTDNKILRFCFAKQEATLAKAADILNSL